MIDMRISKHLDEDDATVIASESGSPVVSGEDEKEMSNVALPALSPDASLSRYLDEINKFPYLTQEEEYQLLYKLPLPNNDSHQRKDSDSK